MAIMLNGKKLGKVHDISLAVTFDEHAVAEFGANPAHKTPFKGHGFVGDVKEGGSCNCDMITFSPHLHGTHTECVGHIVADPVLVHEVLTQPLMLATLVTITPEASAQSSDTYVPELRPDDKLITKKALEKALSGKGRPAGRPSLQFASGDLQQQIAEALVIRTGWSNKDGLPPFFSIEAMEYVLTFGVQHLLVDMPSIDRMDDDGKMTAHHIFWGIKPGTHRLAGNAPSAKTVTELTHVAGHIADGRYGLNLQVAAFAADAAPSRPLLYEMEA